jgi:hypothetical protein
MNGAASKIAHQSQALRSAFGTDKVDREGIAPFGIMTFVMFHLLIGIQVQYRAPKRA